MINEHCLIRGTMKMQKEGGCLLLCCSPGFSWLKTETRLRERGLTLTAHHPEAVLDSSGVPVEELISDQQAKGREERDLVWDFET